jgi:hypothetical protein
MLALGRRISGSSIRREVRTRPGARVTARRPPHRSRATAIADTARRPPGQCLPQAPASRRSSPRRPRAGPSAGDDLVAARPTANARHRALATAELELGDRRPSAFRARTLGGPRWDAATAAMRPPGRSRDDAPAQRGLGPARKIAPTRPVPNAATARRAAPQALLAGVLQVVEGGPDGTGERRAPLELQQRRRDVRGSPIGSRRAAPAARRPTGHADRAPGLRDRIRSTGGQREVERRRRGVGAWPPR